ncbi:NDUFAF3 [Blepharisma stoltei]|uniref:NADH dehydrogenase [ubiquinone] 1 alpha subcomplex assembly factor 3 n=1 Tax=Blepharisma stoltei TaxID=1481888 RepID=A0AAU9JLC2_9CILI|nr:unnamed protein product [Blepharisma stoltei]
MFAKYSHKIVFKWRLVRSFSNDDMFKDSDGKWKTKWDPEKSMSYHDNPMYKELPKYKTMLDPKFKPTKENMTEYELPADMERSKEILQIWAMNEDFFSVNQVWIKGPICVFPEAVFQWHVDKPKNLQEHHFEIAKFIRPKIEYIVVGTGKIGKNPINNYIKNRFRAHGINIDYCATFEACGTFNLCADDRRRVCAFLFPINTE